MKLWNMISIVVGFAGSVLAFMDSVRTASRFTDDGLLLSYPQNRNTRLWRVAGRLGFALLAIAFAIQFVCAVYG